MTNRSNGMKSSMVNKNIKPFRSQRRMDDTQAGLILDSLRMAIRQIHNQNASQLSFEELYRNAYNMVLQRHGEKLYSGVEAEVTLYLMNIGNMVAETNDDLLLPKLVDSWKTHLTTMKMITDILMYMDRTFVIQEKRESVYELGLRIFLQEVVRHENIRNRVLKEVLDNISKERNGELISKDVIRDVLQMLVDLGITQMKVYEDDFEKDFMLMTQQFYHNEAAYFFQSSTCPDYLMKAEKRLAEERLRSQTYLHYSTEDKLVKLVADEMIVSYANQLVNMENSGCITLLQEDKIEDLARMYSLFELKNCRQEIKKCVFDYVKCQGQKLVDQEDGSIKPVDFVDELLRIQLKFDNIVTKAFKSDKTIQKAVKEAFEFFVNKNQRTSRYLSVFLDELMRSKIKDSGLESDMNLRVDKVIDLFRYLNDKDVFEAFYKAQLSKRLLSGRSVSEDAEMGIIRRLKNEMGYLFTSKLEGMFKDIKLSKEFLEKYKMQYPRSLDDFSTELNVQVLTSGVWPTTNVPECILPTHVKEKCDHFKEFYLGNHSGRRITWQTSLGNADIKAYFSNGSKHEFNVSTYQMCILYLFNHENIYDSVLSFQQICDALQVTANELGRHIISLTTPKFRLLNKEPKGRILEGDTKFSVNSEFKSKSYRIRVPLISGREKFSKSALQDQSNIIPESVEEDRRHLIEAAIVRIMKARKTLEHNQLIAEVSKQMSSRFQPSPSDIKKRLESLLEREYVERAADDRKIYKYLA